MRRPLGVLAKPQTGRRPARDDGGAPPAGRGPRAAAYVLLAGGVLALYAPTARYGFVNFDDPLYVVDNPYVRAGLTWRGVVWAFTVSHAANWHPLTWLSHMADVSLFGDWGGGPHLVNAGLHAANTVLLLAFLHRLTGDFWRSAVVAALFAWHPTRVESVAWVSERKDVLSTTGWLLTAHAYLAWVARPGAARAAGVLGAYVLALLAKPMVVTLPVILLVLDWWPLRRAAAGWRALVREKLPLFALAGAVGVVTVLAQHAGRAVVGIDELTAGQRVANAVVAYVRYLGLLAWPTALAIQYPYRLWPPGTVAGAAAVLVAITAGAVALRGRAPYLLAGWAWYALMLAPVSGIVQVGSQALADRFTYLSAVGLGLAVVWGVADLVASSPVARRVAAAVAVVLALAQLPLTVRQIGTWRTSRTLFEHALAVGGPSAIAHTQLGLALSRDGERDAAAAHYAAALRLNPRHAAAHANLANVLSERGRHQEAIAHYEAALAADPGLAEARNGLALVLEAVGRGPEALAQLEAAATSNPDHPEVRSNLANALRAARRPRDALAHYAAAAGLRPDWPDVQFGWGMTLLELGDASAAAARLEQALRLEPRFPAAGLALAWLRATSPDPAVRDGQAAVALAERALAAVPEPAAVDLDTLAATYAEAGRFEDAAATAATAAALARRTGDAGLAAAVEARRALYAARRPYRTPAAGSSGSTS